MPDKKEMKNDYNTNIGIPGRGMRHGRHMGPVEKPKDFKGTVKRLFEYIGKERKIYFIILAFVLLDAALVLLAPYLIGRSIDTMAWKMGVNFKLLYILIAVLLVSYVIDAFASFIQSWLVADVSQRIVVNLRRTLFQKLQKLPVSFFDTHTHGEIMSRLSNDIDNVSSTLSQSSIQLMSGVITIAGSLVMMLILSPLLTLASLITVPLVFLLTKTIARKTKVLFLEQQRELGILNGQIEENITGFEVIKAFNHEKEAVEQFDAVNSKLCDVGLKAQILSGFLMPLMNVINNIGFAAVAGFGGVLAVKNLITVGIIASFLSYSRQFARPLNDIANIFNTLQSAVAGAERVFEILDVKEEPDDLPDAFVLENPEGDVEFKNVSFGYRPDLTILKDIDFDVKKGSTIALVGPTGAGKTTIVNLLARFYDVTEGRILIDGTDIRNYTRDSLRRCFGIVLQDTYLFSGTVRENIKYGNLDASDEEVINAAIMANADIFIRRLPKGYDTVLQESGSNLSQGQRQLLAIARAILANPSILILDEATSSVDTRTELHIQEAMLKLMKGRTSFIIAHRLSTIRDADKILVIENGEIVERGSHESLLKIKNGRYYNMYYNQFKKIDIV